MGRSRAGRDRQLRRLKKAFYTGEFNSDNFAKLCYYLKSSSPTRSKSTSPEVALHTTKEETFYTGEFNSDDFAKLCYYMKSSFPTCSRSATSPEDSSHTTKEEAFYTGEFNSDDFAKLCRYLKSFSLSRSRSNSPGVASPTKRGDQSSIPLKADSAEIPKDLETEIGKSFRVNSPGDPTVTDHKPNPGHPNNPKAYWPKASGSSTSSASHTAIHTQKAADYQFATTQSQNCK